MEEIERVLERYGFEFCPQANNWQIQFHDRTIIAEKIKKGRNYCQLILNIGKNKITPPACKTPKSLLNTYLFLKTLAIEELCQ